MSSDNMDLSQTMLELNEAINQLREREVEEVCCSFCSKPQSDVSLMIPGPNSVYICDLCVTRAAKLIGHRA